MFVPPSVLGAIDADFERFGDVVLSKQVMDWISDAEHHPPYLRGAGYDSWGHPTTTLVTSEGWRNLKALDIAEGLSS